MSFPTLHTHDQPLASGQVSPITELASGVDALHLSGRADLQPALFGALASARSNAEEIDGPVPFPLLDDDWQLEPFSFGRYRYRLVHPFGMVGITTSENLPALRVQPRAEFLHGAGVEFVLDYFQRLGEFLAGGPVTWSLSRLDLFCDVQGWQIDGDDRHRFVCRATRRDLHEESGALTGFEFGRRSTKTVCARIYDKMLQVDKKGLDWWPRIWGEPFDPSRQVLPVEVEVRLQGLVEFGVDSPADGLAKAGDIWANATEKWLSYRVPTNDDTKARWPVAPEWQSVQNATLRHRAIGVDRIRAERRQGELRIITPALVGYLARAGALSGADDLDTTIGAARHLVARDERRRGVPFESRIAERKAEESRR